MVAVAAGSAILCAALFALVACKLIHRRRAHFRALFKKHTANLDLGADANLDLGADEVAVGAPPEESSEGPRPAALAAPSRWGQLEEEHLDESDLRALAQEASFATEQSQWRSNLAPALADQPCDFI